MHHKGIDAYQCTLVGKSGRQLSSMVSIMSTDVQCLEIAHQVDSGVFSSDWYAGLQFMNMALKGFFTMWMTLSTYL